MDVRVCIMFVHLSASEDGTHMDPQLAIKSAAIILM